MKNGIIILAFNLSLFLLSCNKADTGDNNSATAFFTGNGVFVVNEGNFNSGNGSLSFYSFDSLKIRNDLFSTINGRPLGDVPYSMELDGDLAYLIVNNSGKIEVADANTLTSVAAITGLDSPRNMLIINSSKAYVTSLWSDKIAVLNLMTNSLSGTINIRRSSEAAVKYGDKVYISCWVSGNEIIVINSVNDQIIDSIVVGHEPESMVIDSNNRLWALCSGGYSGDYYPELVRINLSGDTVEKRFPFPSKLMYPTALRINGTGDTLFFVNSDIWKMPVSASSLPERPFVKASGRTFYKIGISNEKHELIATNVMNYQQDGYLIRFRMDGSVIDSARTDIIPGNLCFRKK